MCEAIPPISVGFDSRAITIDGRRTLLLSGAIHYPRSLPEQWPALIESSRAAGLNTIETYVFWNLHEPQRGRYDFTGRLDIAHFCDLVAAAGMHLVLRIGPYICAETNYGGVPFWLRDLPGMQMRTLNGPWQREMARWTREITDRLRPYFASHGGPIILAQIENEYNLIKQTYGVEGQTYLAWAAAFAQSLQLGIPWVMCLGGAPGTIETLNGFFVHDDIPDFRRRHPDQPLLWTEHWTGWYDTWGSPHHRRDPREVAFGALRFIAAGGTGINYYMWHGGTNFAREGMYLQTTSYDYDAPLDEYGRPTTKFHHLARLHNVLREYAPALLAAAGPDYLDRGGGAGSWTYGDTVFLTNDHPDQAVSVDHGGQSHLLPPRSAKIMIGEEVLFASDVIASEDIIERHLHPIPAIELLHFAGEWRETIPMAMAERGAEYDATILWLEQPIDQLLLTRDASDYCWYVTTLTVEAPGAPVLRITGAADIVSVFIDGVLVATNAGGLFKEDRTSQAGPDFIVELALPPVSVGTHTLALLTVALGIEKGDWLLGHTNMATFRKGIWGTVSVDGIELAGPWMAVPRLVGEREDAVSSMLIPWDQSADPSGNAPAMTWSRWRFLRVEQNVPLAIDLLGMTRGMLWLNGQFVGRYWLTSAQGASRVPHYAEPPNDEPTQRYYHLPIAWLREHNTLILFDELGGEARQIRLVRP